MVGTTTPNVRRIQLGPGCAPACGRALPRRLVAGSAGRQFHFQATYERPGAAESACRRPTPCPTMPVRAGSTNEIP